MTVEYRSIDDIIKSLTGSKPMRPATARPARNIGRRVRRYKHLERDEIAAASTVNNTGNNMISYVETDFSDFIQNEFVMGRLKTGTDIFCDEVRFEIIPNLNQVVCNVVDSLGYENTLISSSSSRAQMIVNGKGIIAARTNSNSSYVEIMGDQDLIDAVFGVLLNNHSEITTTIEWIVGGDGGDGGSITIPLYAPEGVVDSSYPFIEEGVEQFVDDFLKSSENILLLIGAPGTGKSNFIKYIISRSKKNALITYDPEVMKRDGIFANFIEDDYGSLIMEDADAFLGARTEGNLMMSKFLNVGDGIVSMRGKKLIFSTNLENLDDIDPALLRPGRCFAVVQFRKMTFDEAKQFTADHKITGWEPTPGEEYSLADLYNHTKQVRKVIPKRKVGFY